MNNKATKHYNRWQYQAPLGLVLIGAGISCIVDAAFYRYDGAAWWQWIGYGTIALTIFNAGLSLFVDAGLHRIRYEQANQ
jgi:hypothetical protein